MGTAVLAFLILTPLAAGAPEYISAARPNGVVGGAAARALSAAIVDALRARSDVAEPDGALADAAAWFVAANAESRKRGAGIAARRSGFVGAGGDGGGVSHRRAGALAARAGSAGAQFSGHTLRGLRLAGRQLLRAWSLATSS